MDPNGLSKIVASYHGQLMSSLTIMEENKEASKPNGETRVKKADNNKKEADEKEPELPLMALNHVSRLCRNVEDSINFYTKVLGFVLIERPPAFDFAGAWLFNYGVGIHLVQSNDEDKLSEPDSAHLDPMDNHISFQCEDMEAIEKRLKELGVKYIKRTVKDDRSGNAIDQMFFDDPDGFMIEICNCENLKPAPAGSTGKIKLPFGRHNPPLDLGNDADDDAWPDYDEEETERTMTMHGLIMMRKKQSA